jgi:glycosyltransferase involved in cell wall biosynthesis
MRPSLIELARALGVEDHLLMPGNKDQGWIAQTVSRAGVIVSPHTGRALSEAALGGVPICAYDVDWQGELIETGVTGELVPHKDWKGLAEAAARFLEAPEYARRMGKAVRNRTLEMLDPEALDQHERDQYHSLLDRWR